MAFIDDKKVRSLRWLRKNRNMRVVTTNGCFDLLHPGHVHFFNQCQKRINKTFKGEKVLFVVLVNDDEYLKQKKVGRPVIYEVDRLAMVSALKPVSLAFLFSDQAPTRWLAAIQPDLHFKGADWKDLPVPEEEVCKVEYIPQQMGMSTTVLIEHILATQNRR